MDKYCCIVNVEGIYWDKVFKLGNLGGDNQVKLDCVVFNKWFSVIDCVVYLVFDQLFIGV